MVWWSVIILSTLLVLVFAMEKEKIISMKETMVEKKKHFDTQLKMSLHSTL